VRGHAPESLFACEPDAVDDFVDEAPFAFQALGDYELLQLVAAAVADVFEAGAVAVARVFEEDRGRKGVPRSFQLLLAGCEERGGSIGGERIPGRALGSRGEGVKMIGQFVGSPEGAEQVAPVLGLRRQQGGARQEGTSGEAGHHVLL